MAPERVVSVDPATAQVSLVRPDPFGDIRAEGWEQGSCASEGAAAERRAAHPEGMVHTVDEELGQTRAVMFRIGWAAVSEGRRG